jgi:hypothetical protein
VSVSVCVCVCVCVCVSVSDKKLPREQTQHEFEPCWKLARWRW